MKKEIIRVFVVPTDGNGTEIQEGNPISVLMLIMWRKEHDFNSVERSFLLCGVHMRISRKVSTPNELIKKQSIGKKRLAT